MNEKFELVRMETGSPWSLTPIPGEGCYFALTGSVPMLMLFFNSPKDSEIKDVDGGSVQMGYYAYAGLLFLVFKFGSMPWMDAPYSIHAEKGISLDWSEKIPPDAGMAIQIVLTDRTTGIIKALRLIGASNKFTAGFRAEILKQTERPFSITDYYQTISDVYGTLSSKEIARRAENMFKIQR